jgi:hypothetical protein
MNDSIRRWLPMRLTGLHPSGMSTKELAEKIGVTPSMISQAEHGQAVPSDDCLAVWARTLEAESQLAELLVCAAHDRVVNSPEAVTLHRAFEGLLRLQSTVTPHPAAVRGARTLCDFPRAFAPLVVVCGDKRENPPKTEGDIGALSASPMDDRFLHQIPLPRDTDKVSDKVFVMLGREELKRRFGGKNLLVIGSPATNHVARVVNRRALFRFAFGQKSAQEIEDIIAVARQKKSEGPAALKSHYDSALREFKFIFNEFKQGGIFDPLADRHKVRGRALRGDIDFGTVTLACNPFAEDPRFVAIMAAGFHLPGTVHAVKLLSDPGNFQRFPLGGVLEVKMDVNAPWHERIDHASVAIDSEEYSLEDMRRVLERIAEHPDWPGSGDKAHAQEEVAELIALVEALAGPRSAPSADPASDVSPPPGGR